MTTMAGERREGLARKRAMTRSVLRMVETAEAFITGAGGIEIRSGRLPGGGWGTWMERTTRTGEVDYSRQDAEAEGVMVRLLYRKLSQAVAEPGEAVHELHEPQAHVVLVNTASERAPEYHVPKMVTEVRAWALYPHEEGGFYSHRLPPHKVAELSPRKHHVKEDLDEELGRLTGEHQEAPRATFEEFMAEEEYYSFDQDARKLTREEKLAEWEDQQRRLEERAAGGGQCMPEDEVRYL